ncbi:hypothetical protein NQ314_007922 [Rhamnusium bicolor]|uniref:Uncharacterized protein n=1 Tax=Rhamnusium bicolor TaxID=1586634 RepID=A0AAV8YGR8_9CUCU|nr:hypothetical protein NQ314_007922 [Rhamnusium bicolor]
MKIGNDTENAQGTTGNIDKHIVILKEKLTDLQRNITDNGNFANRVIEESINIVKNAQKTKNDSIVLEDTYRTARNKLEQKLNSVKATNERANELSSKALNLVAKVTTTQEDIQKLEDSSQGDDLEALERQLKVLIEKMNEYTMTLENRVQYYKTCN